jgi:hypothetical protein
MTLNGQKFTQNCSKIEMLSGTFHVLCSFESSKISDTQAGCLGLLFLSSQNCCDFYIYCSWYEMISDHCGSKDSRDDDMCICCPVLKHTKGKRMFVPCHNMSYDISVHQNRNRGMPCARPGDLKNFRNALTCVWLALPSREAQQYSQAQSCCSFSFWIKVAFFLPQLER